MISASLDMLEESLVKKIDIMKKIEDENAEAIFLLYVGFDGGADDCLFQRGDYEHGTVYARRHGANPHHHLYS